MSPNGDMPTTTAQQQNFSLSNIVPQTCKINQNLFEGVEAAVRNSIKPSAGAYVVTNAKDATTTDYNVISIAAQEHRAGLNLFPDLPE